MSRVKSTPKSRGKIQREYRARLKERNYEEALRKERLRWHKRVSSKKVKLVDDLSPRELRLKRKEWRSKKAETRKIKKRLQCMQTPPQTPSTSGEQLTISERGERGRKKMFNNRKKNARLIVKLASDLQQANRVKDKYKHRLYRLQKVLAKKSPKITNTSTSSTSFLSDAPEPSTSALTPLSKTVEVLREIPDA